MLVNLSPTNLVDDELVSILRCPATKQPLSKIDGSHLETLDGRIRYPICDGVIDFLTPEETEEAAGPLPEHDSVKSYYENAGWEKDTEGVYRDSRRFMALDSTAREYTRQCNLRIKRVLPKRGKYLLDAGSGAIPHDEYLSFHDNFESRICVDFSFAALKEAKSRLGSKGRYIRADLCALPFKDASIDAVVCCHTVYHIAAEKQETAFIEQSRVLVPEGKAAIVYQWGKTPLVWRLSRVFELIGRVAANGGQTDTKASDAKAQGKALYFHPHKLEWFLEKDWPFTYEIRSFRIMTNPMMRRFIRDTVVWRTVVRLLLLWQAIMPRYTGKYGAYPLIVLYSLNEKQ